MSGTDESDGIGQAGRLERDALHHQVYRRLTHLVMSGEFRPGAEVTLRSLADAVGTSEMPVRDAVRRLIGERALEFLPGRRFAIPTLTADRYREILHMRLLLEPEASRLAAERLTQEGLTGLSIIQAELLNANEAGGSRRRLWSINRRFHFAIYEAARSPLLTSFIETLWLQIGPVFNHLAVDHGQRDASGHHARILAALARRDPEAAAEAIHRDLTSAATLILAALGENDLAKQAAAPTPQSTRQSRTRTA